MGSGPWVQMTTYRQRLLLMIVALLLAGFAPATLFAAEGAEFRSLSQQYQQAIHPLLKKFCLDCHSTEAREGELDLQQFASFADVRHDPTRWQQVAGMLDDGEMPPEESPQLSAEQFKLMRGWVKRYLDAEARASAGDPGPVVLRRLNNAEYTYTIRDLTGADLDPAKEFPVDGAAGEGFTNTGQALVMSPALVEKYIDAAKQIASHAVLLPDGFRFSSGETRRDWVDEVVAEIRSIYARHTTGNSDVSGLDRWSVGDPTQATATDGRVVIERYLAALIRHRDAIMDNIDATAAIADASRLNAKYLHLLAEALVVDAEPASPLIEDLRQRLHDASFEQAGEVATTIQGWQQQLWKQNAVGHFGMVRRWHESVSPLAESQEFRVQLESADQADEVTVSLIANALGGNDAATVVWNNPRIQLSGRPPIPLRDVRALAVALPRLREQTLSRTTEYLQAAYAFRTGPRKQEIGALAQRVGLDPKMLQAWLSYLGISADGEFKIKEYLHAPLANLGGYAFVSGWGVPGLDALSLVANSSDEPANIPGTMRPHQVAVHPRPERFVAAGWRSPIAGNINVQARVQDAHGVCGNGVHWALELRRGNRRQVLAGGNVDLGGTAAIEPINDLPIRVGDLVSLVIGPRDRNHGCDLTEIDLSISETGEARRQWSLATDCADTIQAGNPHADRHGNQAVWHFYTGALNDDSDSQTIAPGSLLAQWLETSDTAVAAALATQIEELLLKPLESITDAADRAVCERLRATDGPLFSKIDLHELARSVPANELATTELGIDPRAFGRHPDGSEAPAEHLIVDAPTVTTVQLPAALARGAAFAVSGTLASGLSGDASVQLQVTTAVKAGTTTRLAATPFLARPDSTASARLEEAFADFRRLFPPAMCYARIVPVDEVVTLVLFHREDDDLMRLMLGDEEAARLDRLWDELRFVSRDALTITTAFEQLMAFATQDDDPAKYEPLREPITHAAAAFRQRQIDAEPSHLTSLMDFASRAFRRALSKTDRNELTSFYRGLRDQEIPHEQAFRLTLARVLASPSFLYRTEQPGSGPEAAPVSDWELANRLSYFLWSSMPDAELLRAAAASRLSDRQTLLAQTRRMLRDDRARRLAIEFACQWLHIRDFDQLGEKSERHFPTFADLRGDMYEESIQFFTDLFQNDGSVMSIIDGDHTFLNERLARHYGVDDIRGDDWRRVDGIGQFSRGGILAQATTLARQSGASRTSAILRGNWISETLLGERLPRPPADVPQLPETVPAGLSERQLIEQHSSVAACAHCHVRIDPYGFALESFDAIGRYREKDATDNPIDTKTQLADGTEIDGLDGLRNYLSKTRRKDFLEQFCRKLLGYALGRSVQLSDEPLLREMMTRLAENDYRVWAAVEAIVSSKQFRMIRGRRHGQGKLAKASGANLTDE